ncbi:hypothetical protein ElP_50740 [Tautonia plasticadhaerens]|uniref:Uncharacterized protein n=1 Tax=Tautonia plasticadhaerens TaxID=2527974 RepID=A0A518H8I9_9BACT|nr:hypothetical protein ElP_50740 [Tautonia plasticadhaerens]
MGANPPRPIGLPTLGKAESGGIEDRLAETNRMTIPQLVFLL